MTRRDPAARSARPAAEEALRAFFAIDLAERARRAAAALQAALRGLPGGGGVRWVRPEGLHLTLRFLGDVGRASLAALSARVEREVAEQPAFELQLDGVQAFPSKRPRVVALGVEPAARVVALAEAVERGVVAAGLAPERRPFRAHITLGRLREPRCPALEALPGPEASPFEVREVVLFRSQLRPDGARYTPLERLALAAASSSTPALKEIET